MFNSKVFVAELLGTFALVFVTASSGILSGGNALATALGYGLTVAVFIYAFGHISGTHVNPAVTFGLALQGVVDWGKAVVSYWIPQFLGAIVAGFMLKIIFVPQGVDLGVNFNVELFPRAATEGLLNANYPYHAMGLEIILTFFLMNTILHTVVSGKGGMFSGLAIGLTYVIGFLAGGLLTGASMNPARTFGPAVFTGSWNDPNTYIIYFLGPLFGATLAVLVYQFFSKEDEEIVDVEVVEVVEEKPTPAKKPAARKTTTRKTTARKTPARKTTKK